MKNHNFFQITNKIIKDNHELCFKCMKIELKNSICMLNVVIKNLFDVFGNMLDVS